MTRFARELAAHRARYAGSVVVALGLLIHFGISLNKSMKRVSRAAEA